MSDTAKGDTAKGDDGPLLQPDSPQQVMEAVRDLRRLRCRGGGSKPSLSTPRPGETGLDLSRLQGIVDYDPQELTFTALAGTPLAELSHVLAQHGQHLPFDPPWVEAGSTLGGAVASGLAGPASYGYGGLRDFVLGMRCVDGRGRLIRGGGRVVKNAAGFDLPKLMVGSLGSLGVLVEVTCKVFPRPQHRATWHLPCPDTEQAVAWIARLRRATVPLEALEWVPGDGLWCRLAGPLDCAAGYRDAWLRQVGGQGEEVTAAAAQAHWRGRREMTWFDADGWLVKVPLTPDQIVPLEEQLAEKQLTEESLTSPASQRVYGRGGQVLWLTMPASPGAPAALRGLLCRASLDALVVAAPSGLGGGLWHHDPAPNPYGQRVRRVFDPETKFPDPTAPESI